MRKPSGVKHENYEAVNLVGYGLAKFEKDLISAMGYASKSDWFKNLIDRGLAKTVGTLKNRQDLFNPLVRGGRVGWWQNGDRYLHRKLFLDSLFGNLNAQGYALMLTNFLSSSFPVANEPRAQLSPIFQCRFRQLQETGHEAELYFINSYQGFEDLAGGVLEDARLFGDGYDFQLTFSHRFILIEVKGIRAGEGGIRLTEKEYTKAGEYHREYCLVVVSNLVKKPRMKLIYDPLSSIPLSKQTVSREETYYTSRSLVW